MTLTIDGSVAWVTLNRPDALNAIDHATITMLHAHLDELAKRDVRALVLTGRGRAFCAGADLKALCDESGDVDPQGAASFVHRVSELARRIADLPLPVIAAVNGLAYAGGLELLLSCDLVVAARGAQIADAHATYGLLPGAGSAVRLPRVVGPTVAKWLVFTGRSMPAEDLVAHGLVNEVVDANDLNSHVADLAAHLANRSPTGLATMKRLIDDGLDQPVDTALRLEAHAHDAHVHTLDFHEGIAAFAARRSPDFLPRRGVVPSSRPSKGN